MSDFPKRLKNDNCCWFQWVSEQSDVKSLVNGNFENSFDTPVVRGEWLGSRNFLDSDKSEVNRFNLNRIRPAKVQTIETSSGLKPTRKLK